MRSQRGFTLVELLVVIAIIGLLIALLLPAVQAAREAARRSQCQNNLKQLSLGVHAYNDVKRSLPDGGGGSTAATQTYAWTVHVLPYIEEDNLHSLFNFNQFYNSAQNLIPVQSFVGLYHCPSAPPGELVTCCLAIPGVKDCANTDYMAVGTHLAVPQGVDHNGSGAIFALSHVKLREITDGTAKTLMLAESQVLPNDPLPQDWPAYCLGGNCAVGHQWFAYASATSFYGVNSHTTCDETGFQSHHPQSGNFAFVDGHVRSLSEDISQSVLIALTTRNGGETSHGDF